MNGGSLRVALRRNRHVVRAVRSTYPLLNWVRGHRAYYARRAGFLVFETFDEVRFSNRGNEPEAHLRRTRRLRDVRGSDVLVVGVGDGQELRLWLDERPRSLTAVDVVPRWETWRRWPGVTFACMDARHLELPDESFDIVASTAVLEHIDGVERAVREMARVVRADGIVFANFGPLYRTYGGAHYRGAYEHLWLDDAELERYLVRRNREEELSEGLVYLRNGMFSRLTADEYLSIFARHFSIEHLIWHLSREALRYRRTHPAQWHRLVERFTERDLLPFALTVWLRPLAAGAAGDAVAATIRTTAR